jgi:aryl-alcohol dehydrogenase-like predicted oxidoreductase
MPVNLPALCLGGNVFGWTADEPTSFAVLDAAREAGITFLDTADSYAHWANGGQGGQSETIIGRWIAGRGGREELVVATKVGMGPGGNVRPSAVRAGAEGSLRRLGVDSIDLYYAHEDDAGDLAESLGAFDALVREGKARMIGLSNYAPERIREALDICARDGLTPPVALQPEYSLMERDFEGAARDAAAAGDLAVVPYSALASGFLTGKYRPGADPVASARAGSAGRYLQDPRGPRVLEALDAVAGAHGVPVASVALAWLRAQPGVTSPLASARTPEQVAPLAASMTLELAPEELDALALASAPA